MDEKNFATTVADAVANILRVPGDILRDWALAIPMPVAKGIFIAWFVFLIIWVLRLPRDEVIYKSEGSDREVSLRPFAIAALSCMIVIYLIF
ncbi:MAG: hypothetical protein COA73_13615 [Candidatus Hydrogenedentota bacterium]|nr:MAG: hypothetical protein COA73_13615 [Candidatus Hydrogenedentota bacterium]